MTQTVWVVTRIDRDADNDYPVLGAFLNPDAAEAVARESANEDTEAPVPQTDFGFGDSFTEIRIHGIELT